MDKRFDQKVLERALEDKELRNKLLEDGLGLPEELEDRLSLWYCLFGSGWAICVG